jgi:restriction system-associated AAA family ATPase
VKLLRLKITDPKGFRSLQSGFEYHFRTEWELQEEQGFAPFVCAGPNGSGKSNLLEVLAAIFFQLELLRVRRSFLPEAFLYDEIDNPQGLKESDGTPNAYEMEYLIKLPLEAPPEGDHNAHVLVTKEPQTSPQMRWLNPENFAALSEGLSADGICSERERDFLLPQYVLGYSSGENEILSLPFFKMRFIQFDEYWNCLKEQLSYPGRPETRLAYLDNGFSQAILLCNLLFQDTETLKPFREDVGIESLREFRIIIKRSIEVSADVAVGFMAGEYVERGYVEEDYFATNPALVKDVDSGRFTVNLMKLLEAVKDSPVNFIPIVDRLKSCATCWFVDEATDCLYLDYYVNEATREAFRENFDYEFYNSPLALFQAFQVLLTLNLYAVSDSLKTDLYKSDSHYVSETVPTLASDERIMRFKFVKFSKVGVEEPVMLKSLSDGEHQLLHSLGLCLLFKNTNSLFLLDEPETHFNPDWRSNFVTRLHQCFKGAEDSHEMLVTTHTPFLISDSRPEKVLVFNKDKETGTVSVIKPDYNTLGASINKITMSTFGKRETIGGHAQAILDRLRKRFQEGEDKEQLIAEINRQLGDSVEKVLLIKTILDSMEALG